MIGCSGTSPHCRSDHASAAFGTWRYAGKVGSSGPASAAGEAAPVDAAAPAAAPEVAAETPTPSAPRPTPTFYNPWHGRKY